MFTGKILLITGGTNLEAIIPILKTDIGNCVFSRDEKSRMIHAP